MAEILSIRDLPDDNSLSVAAESSLTNSQSIKDDVSPTFEVPKVVEIVSNGDKLESDRPIGERQSPDGQEEESDSNITVKALDEQSPTSGDGQGEDVMRDVIPSSNILPWYARKERSIHTPTSVQVETSLKPGEYVMRNLFAEFVIQADKKITSVMAEAFDRSLSKSLQRGEDAQFDQLLSSFGSVAEHCLPSLLRTLFAWFERQGIEWMPGNEHKQKGDTKRSNASEIFALSEEEYIMERRDLAVQFILCLVLIEVLKQLPVHPGHEDLVNYIENLAFKNFKYRDGVQNSPNAANMLVIADLYAEVIGVLAQSRFHSVRKRFVSELKELRSREPSPATTQAIISLLMGMKFFRVKMVPIEEFEASFQFMQECAHYFLEVKDKDIKHSLAGLFVEILVPVAATVKHEVNVPCLKNFVEMLYPPTIDLATKNKHRLALFPLVTCLLCVGQKMFFLSNWHCFLAMCLNHLKNRDPQFSRVALESLYRLLWVYMIRIKCESNSATLSRLLSIVNSLFPKGSKSVVPRDTPLNIFVKIIQFIAQERLDFAMREIVFDLLSVARPVKIILTPERMNIGLRAFLVIADSLQKKEGEPPMPRTVGALPSGSTMRVKKTYLSKMLTEDAARSIGMSAYYPYMRKVLNGILRALDGQFGRPLIMTNLQNTNKEPDEMMSGERKPKIDLFRTCVAAMPRLIPDGMSRSELVELLSRITLHMDEELRTLAFQCLQNIVVDFPVWREDVLYGYIQFIVKEVPDTSPQLLDNVLRILLQLLSTWRNGVITATHRSPQEEPPSTISKLETASALRAAEGLALVMLCQCRLPPRRVSALILKEVKLLLKAFGLTSRDEEPVLDVMDSCCAAVLDKWSHLLPSSERAALQNVDLQWLSERSSPVWTSGVIDDSANKGSVAANSVSGVDVWSSCLCSFLEKNRVTSHCLSATANAWTIVFTRLNSLYIVVDPTPVSDNRASLLRSAATVKRPVNERDVYLHLWKNYVAFACRVVPPSTNPVLRCASPDISLSSSPDGMSTDRSEVRSSGGTVSPSSLYKLIVPLIRCEVSDMRSTVVNALGMINHAANRDLMEELVLYIREALDRKQGNVRRQRRRDALRLQLVRIFQLIANRGTFGMSYVNGEGNPLHPVVIEFLDGMRQCLELDTDRDSVAGREVRSCFALFVTNLIDCFPLDLRPSLLKRDLRQQLFILFAGWSGKFGRPFGFNSSSAAKEQEPTELELTAVEAMSSVLCCGPCFNRQGLTEDNHSDVYSWLDILLASKNDKVYGLAQETVVLLLEFNPDISPLLDWVVDRCYTGNAQVADGCFLALATIFSAREYPCDHYTAIINVTLMSTGCPRTIIHEVALQLLQVLDARFFGSGPSLPLAFGDLDSEATERAEGGISTLDALLATTYSRSQIYLSRQLAQLHPELTMPMFSEITHRLQTARPTVRQLLFRYLLPWLCNMELVDPNLPPMSSGYNYPTYCADLGRSVPGAAPNNMAGDANDTGHREGWGSAEATEMVLNNLFYVTVKFGDDHPKELEDVWAELCTCWPTNLRVILRYLFIVTGMAPAELLPYAKRVVIYLGRARPERLLDELINELQTIETMSCLIERTETPPFFRVTSLRKTSSHWGESGTEPAAPSGSSGGQINRPEDASLGIGGLNVEKGTIHTKRHSSEDPGMLTLSAAAVVAGSVCNATIPAVSKVCSSPRLDRSRSHNDADTINVTKKVVLEEHPSTINPTNNDYEASQPHPLPMPEYGGYFAPLTEFLPNSSQPVNGFHRCNLAVMFLVDLVVEGMEQGSEVDWSVHLPLVLHMAILGLDHTRPLVSEHCKQLLLNLLLVLADHGDHLTVAKVLLQTRTEQLKYGLTTSTLPVQKHNFTEPDLEFDSYLHAPFMQLGTPTWSSSETGEDLSGDDDDSTEMPATVALSDVIKSLVYFISSRPGQPLWSYEDITSKVWSVRSAEQLDVFVQHICRVFSESLPHSHLEERWAQVALHLALSSPSRHYAGRSLQIFRGLRVPITSRMLTDILSRLVETAAEQGEDMQGYVTELVLTLEASVESLETDFRPMDVARDIFKSTPNLNNKECGSPFLERVSGANLTRRHAFYGRTHLSAGNAPYSHIRSTSYTAACGDRKAGNNDLKDQMRGRSSSGNANGVTLFAGSSLSRSRSAQSLKALETGLVQDDKLAILAQLFWIAVCLLESDYEHEFLLALRLLERVLHRLPLDRPDCRDRVEKMLPQLKWNNFTGVHAIVLKGCTSPNVSTYESTLSLLSQFTPFLEIALMDPSIGSAFAINVMALLPYMVANYEDATPLCIRSAENIAHVSTEKGKKMENLATVMTLYSRRTFSKESFQWTKCVVKYLHDSYGYLTLPMVTFLVEVLERGPNSMQGAVLSILHCLLHYVDFNLSSNAQQVNADLLRVIAKYIEGAHWKEALKILKLAVTRSSSLVAPPSSASGPSSGWGSDSNASSFSDSELFVKKELPGRTMEFTYDLSQTPIIGRRHAGLTAESYRPKDPFTSASEADTKVSASKEEKGTGNGASSPRRSVSLSSADSSSISGWKRPWLSQARVRESLVNLLTAFGQRVGLPKSPSWVFYVDHHTGKVIFSQSSELLERQSSMASSMEEVSTQQDLSGDSKLDDSVTTDQQFGVFKDFDFLEYELESQEDEGMDQFNWGVHRHSLSSLNAEGEKENTAQATPSHSSRKDHGIEESSDDDMGSVSPLDDMEAGLGHSINEFPSMTITRDLPSSLPLDLNSSHSEIHSDSSQSECSEGDGGDVTPCNLSPCIIGPMASVTPPNFMRAEDTATQPHSSLEDIDPTWRTHFQVLVSEGGPSQLVSSLHYLPKLFRDVRAKVLSATRECCHYLQNSQGNGAAVLRQICANFQATADVVATRCECPFIFCESSLNDWAHSRYWKRLRFTLMEFYEHSETCTDRREHALECLGLVQSTLKLQMMGETFPEQTHDEQHYDLCRYLYRLHFQVLLFMENSAKLVNALQNVATAHEMLDMSSDIGLIRMGLYQALEEIELDSLDGSQATPTDMSLNDASIQEEMNIKELEYNLLELLMNKRFVKALRLTRQYRQCWPHDYFGTSDDEELAAIMRVYGRYIASKKSCAIIATCPDESSLADSSGVIMDFNMQTQSTLKALEKSLMIISDSRSDRSDYSDPLKGRSYRTYKAMIRILRGIRTKNIRQKSTFL
ncbi:protein furry-like isoform X2 [Daphnia pulex]|uniref:protein furry-like isoform X2 n=1 Tax=Daphnia pulex TaxID=6669 RepID=UPI001EDD81B7|nr:protein furry-like isoform X2 [Daphnia pulex]